MRGGRFLGMVGCVAALSLNAGAVEWWSYSGGWTAGAEGVSHRQVGGSGLEPHRVAGRLLLPHLRRELAVPLRRPEKVEVGFRLKSDCAVAGWGLMAADAVSMVRMIVVKEGERLLVEVTALTNRREVFWSSAVDAKAYGLDRGGEHRLVWDRTGGGLFLNGRLLHPLSAFPKVDVKIAAVFGLNPCVVYRRFVLYGKDGRVSYEEVFGKGTKVVAVNPIRIEEEVSGAVDVMGP